MKSKILQIINEANFEKDFHFVICDIEVAKKCITEFMCERCGETEVKYNPRNLGPAYKYGLLLFVVEANDEGQCLWENALFYASKKDDLYSGIVVFCKESIVVFNGVDFKLHNVITNSTF